MSGRTLRCLALGAVTVSEVVGSEFFLRGDQQCDVQTEDKVDCAKFSQSDCEAASCCWSPVDPNPSNVPWCYKKAGSVKTCTFKGEPSQPFSDDEVKEIQGLFEANLDIQGSGMVVAAPDHNTGPGGDYYYAWMRDGALSMNALLQTSTFDSSVEAKMDHWLSWVERSYQQTDPLGDIMAEPKFVIPSGKPFPGPWCRPQNDGPGLRAITLMAYSKVKPAVADRAWALVQKQLDWVAANYNSNGCDLWEEVRSTDFFWNRYTMRKALIQGADFAKTVGKDEGRAGHYTDVAKTITEALNGHIDSDGYVFESEGRKMDTAVIEGFNVGDMEDGLFAPLNREVAETQRALTKAFCNEYQVNQQGAQGVLFGRYPGDSYDGGNPWILLTASAATLFYRQSEALAKGAKVDESAAKTLATLLDQDVTAASLLAAGDTAMKRVKDFLSNGMHMNEQIDRNSGALTSAKDLTWNYANVLKAMAARKAAATAAAQTIDNLVVVV